MERTQSQYDRIAAIFFLIVGVFFAGYARTVDIGSWSEPGPGFLPFAGGAAMAVMSVALLIGSFREKGAVHAALFSQS